MKITLHIICKDEVEQLKRIVKDYYEYFDFIDIAIDSREAFEQSSTIFKEKEKVSIYYYTDRLAKDKNRIDFAHKRNFLADRCKGDYYFRLDTDDEIVNPESVRKITEIAAENDISYVTCYYDYSKDEWGNTNAAHYRETIIRKDDNLYWNKPIHENILPRSTASFKYTDNPEIKINHKIDKAHSFKSNERNFKYLIDEYKENQENPDPRTIAYIGRSLMGMGEFDKAIYFLEKHIDKSGWDEDRYLSWCELAEIYKQKNDKKKSIACAFEALQERPDYPDAYFMLHDIYFNESNWKKSLDWALMGMSKPIPKTNMLIDPSAYTWRPMLSMAECYFQLGDFKKAWEVFSRAKEYVPTMEYVKSVTKIYEDAIRHDDYVNKLLSLYTFTKENDESKIVDLVNSIPKQLWENELVAKLRNKYLPPHQWKENEIAIYCGHTAEEWSPKSVKDGIGGSEEATINISNELTKLGYRVTVFNNCGEAEGNYGGVEYKNFIRFNHNDSFNILISWRMNIFDFEVEAKNKIIWLHDLPTNINFTKQSVGRFDKIIVLSKYHASLLPDIVPQNKIFISTNGVNKEFFNQDVKKIPNRLIFASSYNRGLEVILSSWGKIRKEVPDAEIHCFYGWNVYDKMVREYNLNDAGFKERMIKLFKQEGVYEYGRIGHKELAQEYLKSSIFAYPCNYSGEINCIALSKALLAGCSCVTNDFAVCKERNPHYVVTDSEFIDKVIEVLKSKDRKTGGIVETWEDVAKDWVKFLFPVEMETVILHRDRFPIKYFDKEKDKDLKIIDIGANNGHYFYGWDRKNITSVDIDKYDYEGFVQANAEELPFLDNSFDKALFVECLEHTKNPIKALSEARRVAKRVYLTVPYEHEWLEWYAPFNTKDKELKERKMSLASIVKEGNPDTKEFCNDGYDHLWHETHYTPELLKEHLEKAGYTDYKMIKMRFKGLSWLGVIGR